MQGNKSYSNRFDIDTILSAIYGYYTQYVVLGPISNNAFARTRADKLSIFIDLDDIFVHLDRFGKDIPMSEDLTTAITSGLINMCAHYRNFFNNSFGVSTYIFMVGNSMNEYIESSFCGEYTHPQISPTMMVCKNTVMQMLQYISAYIPDVYTVDHRYDFNAMVVSITSQAQFSLDNMPGLVISKDQSALLLGAEGLTILRPKKYKGEDMSYMVLPELAYDTYISQKTRANITEFHNNDNLMISTLVAIAGFLPRKIKSSKSINSVVNAISKCISDPNNRVINSHYISDESLLNIIRVLKIKDELANPILERYHSLCPSISSNAMKMNGDFIKAYNRLVDVYDPEKMKKLNETTFKKYPLDLNAL